MRGRLRRRKLGILWIRRVVRAAVHQPGGHAQRAERNETGGEGAARAAPQMNRRCLHITHSEGVTHGTHTRCTIREYAIRQGRNSATREAINVTPRHPPGWLAANCALRNECAESWLKLCKRDSGGGINFARDARQKRSQAGRRAANSGQDVRIRAFRRVFAGAQADIARDRYSCA